MRVWRAAAAVGASRTERAEHNDRADRRIDDEAAVGDVHPAWYADIAAVRRIAFAGVCATFCSLARIAPRHSIFFPFEKRIEIGIGGGDQRVARVALVGWNGVPLLSAR